jgi:hypothetical protein
MGGQCGEAANVIALAIAALGLCATAMGLVIWAVPKLLKKIEGGADTAIALAATEAELERIKGELAVKATEEDETHRLNEALAEELRHALSKPTAAVGAGLAADDVGSRLLRLADQTRAARLARRGSGADPVVPERDTALAPGRPAATGSGAPG